MSREARTLVLMGGGGHAAVVAEAARLMGWAVAGSLDDRNDAAAADLAAYEQVELNRLGRPAEWRAIALTLAGRLVLHAAVGSPRLRRQWLGLIDDDAMLEPIVHPSAIVSSSARIEPGVFIGPRAVINARSSIGRGVIINSGAIVEHDCQIGDFAHIAPGAVLAGSVIIGEDSLVGLNASILPGISIGRDASVGAGAVVIDDVPESATAVGVPARVLERA